jgi:hypothetical protein
MTRSICSSASDTLELLTRDLEPGGRAEFRDRAGVHMTLFVERLPDVPAGSLFIVAHYHRGREPIPDPEVALLRRHDGRWIPLSIALPLCVVVTTGNEGVMTEVPSDEHCRLVKLVDVWMANVRANLLRTQGVLQKEELCSPVAYLAE